MGSVIFLDVVIILIFLCIFLIRKKYYKGRCTVIRNYETDTYIMHHCKYYRRVVLTQLWSPHVVAAVIEVYR